MSSVSIIKHAKDVAKTKCIIYLRPKRWTFDLEVGGNILPPNKKIYINKVRYTLGHVNDLSWPFKW
jgi:hypothetical protein